MKIKFQRDDFSNDLEHDLKTQFRSSRNSTLPLNELAKKKPAIVARALHAATDACAALAY